MARQSESTDLSRFKAALDRQNLAERAKSDYGRAIRSSAEGEAAHHGLGPLDRQSKGRPERDAPAKKSPQSARSQSR